jgi:serine/threonine protein kinase
MPITNPDHLCINCMREKADNGVCPFCGFDEAQYEPSPHHLPPKNILSGKYLIGRVLGEGGFGITYLGWDLNLDLKLAIKEYYPTGYVTRTGTSTNTVTPYRGEKTEFFTTGRARFINEAKTLAKFYALPGIVSVRDFFLENGTAYIVMEFVEGETLKQRLSRVGGKMAPSEVFDLMRPLLRSLAQMHASGLIHRDISPDNIMITPENNVKLIDFGAARDYLDSGNRSLSVMLKPGYAPEEQYFARGQQGPWTDIYALCATIYRAITGITPPESVERLRHDELKAPSELGVPLLPAQEAALLRGLAVSQEDRWQTVIALYDAFYPKQNPAVLPVEKVPKNTHRPNTTKAKQTQASSKRKPAVANTIRQWSMPKRIAIGAASLILVCAVVFFTGASLNTSGSEVGFFGTILSRFSATEQTREKENGAAATSLPIKQDVSAITSPVTSAPVPVVATPTQAPATAKPTPAAKPTATPKKEGDTQGAPAPATTATPKSPTTSAPTATPTATPGAATSWSGWMTNLPGDVSSPTYSIESKSQYCDVTWRFDGYVDTYYRYQNVDGSWTSWGAAAPEVYIASESAPCTPHYTAVYGTWVDGEKASYKPFFGSPTDYYGVETRTVYRYKHN